MPRELIEYGLMAKSRRKSGSMVETHPSKAVNEIAIGIKHDKQVLVASERCDWMTAGEVGCNQILEFFVSGRVDDSNGDITGLPGCGVQVGLGHYQWGAGGLNRYVF